MGWGLYLGAATCGAWVGMTREAGTRPGAEAVIVMGPVAAVARTMAKQCPPKAWRSLAWKGSVEVLSPLSTATMAPERSMKMPA